MRRSFPFALVLLGTAALAEDSAKPKTLNDCLLMAAQKATSESILASERLCREVFAAQQRPPHALGQALYYLAGTGKCLRTEVFADGSAEGGFGLCSQQARFERDATGRLLFTCVLPTLGEPPAVYGVSESAEQLVLRAIRKAPSGMPANWTVWKTLAACSLAVTDEERHLASKLAERAGPEWLDAPLAAWTNGSEAGAKSRADTHD